MTSTLKRISLFNAQASKGNLLSRLYTSLSAGLRRLMGTPEFSRTTATFLGTSKFAIDSYLARIAVEPIVGTRLVRVSFRSPDAILSARIANTHVKDFLRLNQNLRRQAGRPLALFSSRSLLRLR